MNDPTESRLERLDPKLSLTLRDHVHKAVRMAILSGRFAAGDKLNERTLADELGVSTTPLKEAMRQLESEGLISTLPRRGAVVLYGRTWAEEMILARAALESMIARLAAQRIDKDAATAMKATVAAMTKASDRSDADELVELNEVFHEQIHVASQCNYLGRLIERQRFYDESTRRIINSAPKERARALAEHSLIAKAITTGDAEAAERAMRDHVVRSGDHYLSLVFPQDAQASTAS